MTLSIRLETTDDPPAELCVSHGEPISLGREAENTLTLPSGAVSRHHGFILCSEVCWVFRDNHSTNGTWLNSKQLRLGQHVVLRDRDVLQLADYYLTCTVRGQLPESTASLLVFGDDGFVNAIRISPGAPAISIGGADCDLNLGQPSNRFEISRVGTGLSLRFFSTGSSIHINGLRVTDNTALVDQDEVVVGDFSVLIYDPLSVGKESRVRESLQPVLSKAPEPPIAPPQAPKVSADISPSVTRSSGEEDWQSEAGRRRSSSGKKFVFGSGVEEFDPAATVKVPTYQGQQANTLEMSVSQRFSRSSSGNVKVDDRRSEDVAAIFGVLVFMAIISFVIYMVQALV